MSVSTFRAGVGRVTITPPANVPHAGWGAQTHVFADGVETDLWCTVLVLHDGHEAAALVDLDLVIVSGEESEAIRAEVAAALNVPPQKVRVSVTHNHAGPPPSDWDWMKDGTAALAGYYALLPEAAAEAARMARGRLRPARIAVGSGQSTVAVNRRESTPGGRVAVGTNPLGVIDPHVLVIRIDGDDGSPLAAIVGYTMHPTTMGPTNRMMSADWPGHLKRTMETLTGATCVFIQGATGNVGPGPEGFTDDAGVIRKLGALVACEAARVYFGQHLPPVEFRHERIWESGAPLGKWTSTPLADSPRPVVRTRTREVRLPLNPLPPAAEAEAGRADAQRRLHALLARGAPPADIEAATVVAKRANMLLRRVRTFGGRADFPVELHVLQVGPAALAAIPCEPFADIALEIKAASPFPYTWFGGYVGGWFGYMPVPEEYPRGGYEVDTSPYRPEAAGIVVNETIAALRELHREPAAGATGAASSGALPAGGG